jgi:hypothetical protein
LTFPFIEPANEGHFKTQYKGAPLFGVRFWCLAQTIQKGAPPL